MARSGKCPKCGSTTVMTGARIVESAHEAKIKVEVHRKPDAKLFKGAVRVPVEATVCGECGFTELYAADPARLQEAQRRSD